MREFWNTPLGKDIIVVLIIKLIAVYAIWWFFFRPIGEQRPLDAAQMSASILGKQPQEMVKPIPNLSATNNKESLK
ncbi:MAG: hypothetical protein HOP20_08230 [Sulfuriferula sp.]|nr:hypothetical protein [Sulfuriferula sp.]